MLPQFLIVAITDQAIQFRMKDYAAHGRKKIIELAPVEFLRRFCLHILSKGFVKIRYYSICSAACMQLIVLPTAVAPPERTEASTGGGCEHGPV